MVTIVRLKTCNDVLRKRDAELIGEALKRGGVAVFPTDTVYGLGGDPRRPDVVEKVLAIKKRQKRALPVLASSNEVAAQVAKVNELSLLLMEKLWPGPVTLILPCVDKTLATLVGHGGKIGIRVPDCRVARYLSEILGGLIVGTSANISREVPPTSFEEVPEEVLERVEVAVDAGRTKYKKASTVIEVLEDKLVIRREGPVGVGRLEELLRGVRIEKAHRL